MGICTSCEAVGLAPTATVKVILPDGELWEHNRQVRVSHVLQKDPACFVCDADVMEFDGFVSAVGADEELQPGNLYFVLPKTMLKRPLRAEELAALAVRASSALMKAAPAEGWNRRVTEMAPLAFDVGPGERAPVGSGFRPADEEKRKANKKGRGVGRKFTPDLSAIPE